MRRWGSPDGSLPVIFRANTQHKNYGLLSSSKSLSGGRKRPRRKTVGVNPYFSWLSAATADTLADTASRSVGRLDVLSKYACGGLGRAPCLRGVSAVSRRQP